MDARDMALTHLWDGKGAKTTAENNALFAPSAPDSCKPFVPSDLPPFLININLQKIIQNAVWTKFKVLAAFVLSVSSGFRFLGSVHLDLESRPPDNPSTCQGGVDRSERYPKDQVFGLQTFRFDDFCQKKCKIKFCFVFL